MHALRALVRAARRDADAKVRPDAERFVVGERVDFWRPPPTKMAVAFGDAVVARVKHPTYWVTDSNGKEHRSSVRRLRKIPLDPFAPVADDEKKVGGRPPPESDESDDDSDNEQDDDHDDLSFPDPAMLASLKPGDFFLYRDGGRVYGGYLMRLLNDAAEFQEAVFKKKGTRIKAEKTWISRDGVVYASNYKPKASEPVVYKVDPVTIMRRIVLDTLSLLPVNDESPDLVLTR